MSSSNHDTMTSSSTTRTRRAELFMAPPPIARRYRHVDLAGYARWIVCKMDFAVQFLRQPSLDQAGAKSFADGRRYRRAAVFFPEKPHPIPLRRYLNLPCHVDTSGIVRERAIFHRVGC